MKGRVRTGGSACGVGTLGNKQLHAIDSCSPTCCNQATNLTPVTQPFPGRCTPLSTCIYPSVAPSPLHEPTLGNRYSAGRGSHDVGQYICRTNPARYTTPFGQRGWVTCYHLDARRVLAEANLLTGRVLKSTALLTTLLVSHEL